MNILYFMLALVMGAIISIYVPMIAQTAKILNSAPMANVPFFAVGLIASIIIAIASGAKPADFAAIPTVPALLLTAGAMSAFMVIGTSYLVPVIGLSTFFVLMVSGQVLAGMVFGQLGLFGIAPTPLTLGKIAGAVMVIGGVWLVTFK